MLRFAFNDMPDCGHAQDHTVTWIPHLDKRKTSLEPDAMRAKMVV